MFHPDPARPIFKGKRLLYMEESMFHWLFSAGCIPSLVPTLPPSVLAASDESKHHYERLVSAFDALVISGGVDMAPEHYGESPLRQEWSGDAWRDAYDMALVRAAIALDRPVFGVCRGLQVINVTLGGALYQDIETQCEGSLTHRDWDKYDANHHAVTLEPGGRLAQLYGDQQVRSLRINSVHHQGIKRLGEGLVIEARSPQDGVIEAVRLASESRYVMAVQWHPEFQRPDEGLLSAEPLVNEFLSEATQRRDERDKATL